MQEISKSNLYTYIILSISNLTYSLYYITSIHNFLLNEYFNKSTIELHCFFYVSKEDLFLTYILKKVIHINLIYNKTFGCGEDWCLVFAMIWNYRMLYINSKVLFFLWVRNLGCLFFFFFFFLRGTQPESLSFIMFGASSTWYVTNFSIVGDI